MYQAEKNEYLLLMASIHLFFTKRNIFPIVSSKMFFLLYYFISSLDISKTTYNDYNEKKRLQEYIKFQVWCFMNARRRKARFYRSFQRFYYSYCNPTQAVRKPTNKPVTNHEYEPVEHPVRHNQKSIFVALKHLAVTYKKLLENSQSGRPKTSYIFLNG